VLDALLILYTKYVKLPTTATPLSDRIAEDNKYFPWFEDYLGALDRTHIPAKVPTEDQVRYRNRKGSLTQNILAVCDFDMRFLYILAGWEGSAHDGRVLKDAQNLKGFTTPKGKYWLGDAGYNLEISSHLQLYSRYYILFEGPQT
jgi:hypothetical protein